MRWDGHPGVTRATTHTHNTTPNSNSITAKVILSAQFIVQNLTIKFSAWDHVVLPWIGKVADDQFPSSSSE
jgi:hypothetical protein